MPEADNLERKELSNISFIEFLPFEVSNETSST